MNEQRSSLQPAPGPMCAALAPLLPLLSLGKLDPDEAATAREHVVTCDFCQSELRDFDAMRDALRRHGVPALSAEPTPSSEPVPALTLAAILAAANRDDDADEERAGRADHVAAPPLATRSGPIPARLPRRGRGRLTGLGALAATLLLALLAGALFRWHAGTSSGMLVRGIRVPVPGLGTLTEFRLPTTYSQPDLVVAGPGGTLWFAENGPTETERIGRITPGGVVAQFPLPAGVFLLGLAPGPDGNLWFTVDGSSPTGAGKIGRLSPRDGKVTWFAPPTPNMYPVFIVAEPGGDLWFATGNNNLSTPTEIGRITPGGEITEYPLPHSYVDGLAMGPDGNVWFFLIDPNDGVRRIGRMSPAGAITWFSVPPNSIGGCKCYVSLMTAGPDGALWFLSGVRTQDPNVLQVKIGRISPQGVVTEFPLPGNLATYGSGGPRSPLAVGPDGNAWFVAGDGHTLGRITPQGAVTTFALPRGVYFADITLGPDGTLWFTDPAANAIDRLELNR